MIDIDIACMLSAWREISEIWREKLIVTELSLPVAIPSGDCEPVSLIAPVCVRLGSVVWCQGANSLALDERKGTSILANCALGKQPRIEFEGCLECRPMTHTSQSQIKFRTHELSMGNPPNPR